MNYLFRECFRFQWVYSLKQGGHAASKTWLLIWSHTLVLLARDKIRILYKATHMR